MHQLTWDLHHQSIGIDVPFHCAKFKKIVEANLKKMTKLILVTYIHTCRQTDRQTDRQTYIHTYRGYLIGPSPSRGPKYKNRKTKIGIFRKEMRYWIWHPCSGAEKDSTSSYNIILPFHVGYLF